MTGGINGLQGVVLLGALFFSGLLPAIIFKPTVKWSLLGLLAIALALFVDSIVSEIIVRSQQLDLDRFPMNIELFLFGFILTGWLVGSAISGFARKRL